MSQDNKITFLMHRAAPASDPEAVGRLLVGLRQEYGLSCAQAAMGSPRSTFSAVENGTRPVRLSNLLAYAISTKTAFLLMPDPNPARSGQALLLNGQTRGTLPPAPGALSRLAAKIEQECPQALVEHVTAILAALLEGSR